MADLDDFFAKKDKKKSKGKKFTTADEIAKKLEETGKKSEKPKKDKLSSQIGSIEGEEKGPIVEEDEWKDFEEEKKDYTGLKIQNITINDGEDDLERGSDQEDESEVLEENEAGEMVPRKRQTGPWKFIQEEGGKAEEGTGPPSVEERSPVEEKPAEPAPTKPDKYVPPHLKYGGGSSSTSSREDTSVLSYNAKLKSGGSSAEPRMAKQQAPDVKNEELFPSLSAAATQELTKKKKEVGPQAGFEEVRNSKSHTARYEPPNRRRMADQERIQVGNRFDSLSSEQS